MPDESKYNLLFRPLTYFEGPDSNRVMIAKTKGELRKRMVKKLLAKARPRRFG
jgi:hypothetical protein